MKIFTTGLMLKGLVLVILYFWEVASSTSVNRSMQLDAAVNPSMNTLLRSEMIQPIPHRISNDLSDNESFEGLESAISGIMGKYNIRGASVAVAKDGQLVYAKGFGYADAEAEESVEPRHLFRVASVSKLITAVTIMKMAETGLLDIDDRVFGPDGILNGPAFLEPRDPRVHEITVRHLLNHSAGWDRRYGDPMGMHRIIARRMNADWKEITVTDIAQHTLRNRLHFNPGSRISYSNLGYAILGEVIEAVSGQDYESYVRQTILAPLGIFEMRIGKSLLSDRLANEVKYYEIEGRQISHNDPLIPVAYGGNNIELLGAAGGWIASPAEILKLVVAIDTMPSTHNILSPETIRQMTDLELAGGNPLGWAGIDGKGNWWRTGTLTGTSALVMRQNDGISWAVFFNSSTVRGIYLPAETHLTVHSALNQVHDWPDHDLFYHFDTRPFLYPDIAELR
jgi:CubicO group peptidase (beta-lactamase class C family)